MSLMSFRALFLVICFFAACGSSSEANFSDHVPIPTEPFLARLDPEELQAGQNFSVFGFGFSIVPEENILFVADQTLNAETYSLVDPPNENEIEELTFTLPADTELGVQEMALVVLGHSSNVLDVTINP